MTAGPRRPCFRSAVLAGLLLAVGLPAAEDILVVRPDLPAFATVSRALMRELGSDYTVTEVTFAPGRPSSRPAGHRPQVVVALDNQGLTVARLLAPGVPLIGAMGLGLRHELEGLKAAGVAYEVAPFTVLSRFQAQIPCPVRRVLAPCWATAPEHEDSVRQLARAGITLVPVPLAADTADADAAPPLVRAWLRGVQPGDADVLLVPADNRLVNHQTLPEWQAAARRLRIPFITTTEALVDPHLGLCLFAATPDPEGLAGQIAAQVQSVVEGRSAPAAIGVEPPLAVRTVVDRMLLRRLGLQENAP